MLDIFKIQNYFFKKNEIARFSGNEIALFFYLLNEFLKSEKYDNLEISNKKIELDLSISFNTLRSCRSQLQKFELLQFETNRGKNITKYSLGRQKTNDVFDDVFDDLTAGRQKTNDVFDEVEASHVPYNACDIYNNINNNNIINIPTTSSKKENLDFQNQKNHSYETAEEKKEKNCGKKENKDFGLSSDTSESKSWRQSVALLHQVPQDKVLAKLEEFVLHLASHTKNHTSKQEFIKHFNSWLILNLRGKNQKQKTYEKPNNTTKKPYRFDVERASKSFNPSKFGDY